VHRPEGFPFPNICAEEVKNKAMDLKGKKVIALGDRDSVPGEVIAAVAEAAGAEVVAQRTECFV